MTTYQLSGYKNTNSSRGKPALYQVEPSSICEARVWINREGIATYGLHLKNGDTYLTEEYIGINNVIGHICRIEVTRKKYLID